MRLMLDGHPDLTWHRGWEGVADAIAALAEPGATAQRVAVDGLEPFTATDLNGLKRNLADQITALAAASGKAHFGATCHVGFEGLAKLWPDAKFIHLVRDPRDVAISNMTLGWSGHYYTSSESWIDAERAWERLSGHLNEDKRFDIRYEDLVATPEAELKRLCRFLGLPYSDRMFSYVKAGKYSYPKKELAQRWRKKIQSGDVALIEAKARHIMPSRGYEPAEREKQYSALQLARFRAADRWTRRLHRIRSNGLLHVGLRKVARMLNLPALNRYLAKVDEKKRARSLLELEKNY